MRHYYVNDSRPDSPDKTVSPAHYGISTDGFGQMLLQVGDVYGEQSRVRLTVAEAEQFMEIFSRKLTEAKNQEPAEAIVEKLNGVSHE